MTSKIEIELGDDADAEACDAVVCARLTSPLIRPDNLIDLCAKCGEAIQYRPHVPKKPPKICIRCLGPLPESTTINVTPTTVAEVAAYLRKKNAN